MKQRIRKICKVIIIYHFLFSLNASAEISGTQDLTINYYNISGNKENSFYEDNDWDYIYEGKIDFNTSLGNKEFFGSLSYRATDDINTDPQDLSLETFYIGLKDSDSEYLLGDFYSNFSEYSLGNALKGIKLDFGLSSPHHLIILAGIDTAVWEDLWEKRCDDSNLISYVWGIRLENKFLDNKLNLNFNYGAKLDDPAYSSSSAPLFVNVFSIETGYEINNYLRLSGEYAYSITDEDRSKDEVKSKGDPGYKVALDFNSSNYSLTAQYSRVYSHFNTTGGFSAQDLETISLEGTMFLPLNITFTHYLNIDRDNLTKTQITTTKEINPGAKVSFTLPANILIDLGIDSRKRFSTDKETNENTNTYSVNLAREFKYCYFNIGYTRTAIDDKVDGSQERLMDDVSLGLDGDFEIKNVKFSWDIQEDFHHEDYQQVNEADNSFTHSIGIRADFPSTLAIEVRATIGDNDYYLNDTDNYTTDFYLGISKNIKDSLSFAIYCERKDYDYADASNNYKETIGSAKLSYKF